MGEWMWRLQDFKLSVRVKRSVYHAVEGARAEDMRDCRMMHIPPWYLYTSCGVGETRAGMPRYACNLNAIPAIPATFAMP